MVTLLVVLGLFCSSAAHAASETLTAEPGERAYNFVTHYRIVAAAPVERVWPVLIGLGSWMYEFELSSVSGEPGTTGQVLELYEGQPFLMQVTAIETGKMLTAANLPLEFNGELGTGVGIFTLHDLGDSTEVALSMSRRYSPMDEGFRE